MKNIMNRIKCQLLIIFLLFLTGSIIMGGCSFKRKEKAEKKILESGVSAEEALVSENLSSDSEDTVRIICEQVVQMDFTVNEPVMNVTEEEERRYREAYLKVLKNEIPAYGETYYADLWKAGIEFETLLEHRNEREFLYCYYYDDLDGDGKPEFAINQGCMYLLDYDMEKAECTVSYSQESCYFEKILGAGQIWYHDGLHGGVIRDSLYLLNGQNEWEQVLSIEEGIYDPPFYVIEITPQNISADVGKENWDTVTTPFFEMSKEGLSLKTLEEVFGDLLEVNAGCMENGKKEIGRRVEQWIN